jgi:phytoene dehydrogenase-like protein
LLAKQGKRVLVVEQHDKPGGFCTSWERFVKHKNKKLRFVFDAGVHDIAAVGYNRRIPYLLKELDLEDHIEWLRVSHEYIFPDFKLKIPFSVDDYINELCKHFPDEQDGLASFFKEAEICCREFYSLFDMESAERNKKIQKSHFFRWSNVSLMDMIGNYIRNPRLKQVLSLIAHYLTDNPTKLNASVGIPLYAYYIDGGYYPRGSSQTLSNTLADAINKYGGKVRLGSAVFRILLEDRRARGIQLANGKVFYADTVISNADIRRTFLELVGRDHLPSNFSRQIENLQPSNSAFMVFLGVDFIPDVNPITYIMDEADIMAIMTPSKVDPSLAPRGYACVTLAKLLPHDQAITWNRNESGYAEQKKKFGDRLIALAEKAIPGLKEHIIYRQEASPATFARYAWTTDGAIYALAIDEWRPPMKTHIKGLYLAGSGASARPGVEDVVYTGIRAAESVVREERKIHKDI